MTPFEIFRTPITLYRLSNGIFVSGRWIQGSQVTLSTELIIGNNVDITLNGISLVTIPFTVSHEDTMEIIKAALLAELFIKSVQISGEFLLTITVEAYSGFENLITVFNVTGGASVPTVSILNAPSTQTITASIQPTNGEDMQLLPEGRDVDKTYKLYTSTQINTVTSQNPDQVEIFGERYEVMQVFPWQNNNDFLIVNHLKFIAMKIEELKRP